MLCSIQLLQKTARIAPSILIFLAGSAGAAPAIQQVTGTFNHKAIVTVNGTAFGTKTTAPPVVWDDASGNNISEKWDGAWPNNNTAYNTNYRAPMRGISLPHPNITRYIAGAHAQSAGANGGYNVVFWKHRVVSFPAYSFLSWYERGDDAWVFGGDNNYKTYAWSQGYYTPYNLPNNWYLAFNTPKPTSRTDSASYIFGDDSWGLSGESLVFSTRYQGSAINPFSGAWKKVQMEVKWTNSTDGFVRLWENGVLRVNYTGRTDGLSGTQRSEGIGGYARNYGQPNNWRYWADVYLDYSLARVVLANNANLSNASIIEPQIPTTWNANSIGISVNLGKFTSGQTAYLFVTDSSGARNTTGYAVTVGGSQQTILPPGSLKIIQ